MDSFVLVGAVMDTVFGKVGSCMTLNKVLIAIHVGSSDDRFVGLDDTDSKSFLVITHAQGFPGRVLNQRMVCQEPSTTLQLFAFAIHAALHIMKSLDSV